MQPTPEQADRYDGAQRRPGQRLAAVVVVLAGTLLSAWIGWHAHEVEAREIVHEIETELERRVVTLRRELDLSLEALASLAALYDTFGEIDREQFRVFASQAIERYEAIRAIEWIPRVAAAERERFESRAREEGLAGFEFTERRDRGEIVPAGSRSEHFPVYFIEPMEGNLPALGFDLGSDPKRLDALRAARDQGEARATERVRLVQEPAERHGFLIFHPIYRGSPQTREARRESLRGFVLAVYRVDDLVKGVPGPAGVSQGDLGLRLIDDTDPDAPIVLYGEELGGPLPETRQSWTLGNVAGRHWSVVALPGERYIAALRTNHPVRLFLVGLLFTACLVGYLRILGSRQRAVERTVGERTSDMRELNERLEEQRGLLQLVLDNLGDGVAVADEQGNLTRFNKAARQILGVGPVDGAGPDDWSEIYGLYDPETREPIPTEELPLARAVHGESSGDVEMYVRNPNRRGGLFIRVTATPLRDQLGNLRGGVAVFRDISERKWAESLLRDSEVRFRTIVEATSSALIILSPDHRIQEFNPQAEQIFGFNRAEALGQDFFQLCLPEEFRAAVASDIDRALVGERSPGFETPVQTRDGAERTLLWSFSRMLEPDHESSVIIATGHDITERRQAEESRRVRELAAHLQSARENERSRVAREIHDELGQALTGLKFQISALGRRAVDGDNELSERLGAVGRMIDDRIGSVRRLAAALRPQILDELGLIEAIRWQVGEFEQHTGVECTVELPDEEIPWSADRATAMFRMLQESLTNVARHAEASHVTVTLVRHPDQVVLEVRDDGRGITEDQRTHSHSFGLLGMRERARMFGGVLRIQGRAGEGTTVSVRMPC